MRYTPEHKNQARQKIIHATAGLAKRDGFGSTGLDGLMQAAGMTSGAFYKHFQGKEQLLEAIVGSEIKRSTGLFLSEGGGSEELLLAVQAYLSPHHVKHSDKGCILPALSGEVGRASSQVKASFERELLGMMSEMNTRVGDSVKVQAMLAMVVGGVLLARAMETPASQTDMLNACLKVASEVIEPKAVGSTSSNFDKE